MLDFSGKKALVVGGSSGIGNGIAQAFRARGAAVTVWGTRASAADYDGGEGSDLSGLTYARVDASNRDDVDRETALISSLDVLVLCQGTVRYNREEFERPGWDAVMEVNITSVMDVARGLKATLAADGGGSMIIVSSVAGFGATIGTPAYAASKHAAVGLTKTLGAAWARDGIRVNGLAPGLVETKLTHVTTRNEKRLAGALRSIPQGRMGTPDDMAGVAMFLASPLASYVTGQTIIADGGLSLQ
ncbi:MULTISPECIES: SDR family NAD(P)-dependent oxidoreductase [Henriciella]|uniref:3-oxoacyl-ACP reductase n=1 Tax=Henriciella pelagia TaxID=1977912 RepID=A0ABQ1J9H3_9PROT|nr:SDR family oxidoreductase [Henriciella pelagia]GGB62927.1 3-oxoacyl-ACP reductase [Henriciella pelagia]